MCGIAGVVELSEGRAPSRACLERMAGLLSHRGPDDEGFEILAPCGLAHRRLSIIDLGGGHQPMYSEDRSLGIVFNGEIYNFPALRAELEANGTRFRTNSDTEVLLYGYRCWGRDLPSHLNGMFAFAIWDTRDRKLFAATDRLGKKPFYYSHGRDRFVFASEMKAILACPEVERSVDPEAVDEYLSTLYIAAPRSIFKHVRKLPPAHRLELSGGRLEVTRYWDVRFEPNPALASEQAALDGLEERFRNSVRKRLISDVPLGALLSGGIDSSAVVGVMASMVDRPVQTFSIGFEEREYSELPDAQVVARHFGTDHHEFVVRPSAMEVLPDLVWHFDEPFGDSSAVPTYYVAKMAATRVKVVLAGDGGDELFAGYTRYGQAMSRRRWRWIPAAVRRGLLAPLAERIPLETPGRNLLYALGHDDPLAPGYGLGLYPYIKGRLYSDSMRQRAARGVAVGHLAQDRDKLAAMDPLARLQYLDTTEYLPHDILTKVDRMSMAHSLEVRAPLLDYELVEFMASVPSSLKLRGGVLKYLFRKLCERFLPPEVLTKPKQGFALPKGTWFRGALRDTARDRLLDRRALGRGYFNPRALEELLRNHDAGRRDYSEWIWALLVLEEWHQLYIDPDTRRI